MDLVTINTELIQEITQHMSVPTLVAWRLVNKQCEQAWRKFFFSKEDAGMARKVLQQIASRHVLQIASRNAKALIEALDWLASKVPVVYTGSAVLKSLTHDAEWSEGDIDIVVQMDQKTDWAVVNMLEHLGQALDKQMVVSITTAFEKGDKDSEALLKALTALPQMSVETAAYPLELGAPLIVSVYDEYFLPRSQKKCLDVLLISRRETVWNWIQRCFDIRACKNAVGNHPQPWVKCAAPIDLATRTTVCTQRPCHHIKGGNEPCLFCRERTRERIRKYAKRGYAVKEETPPLKRSREPSPPPQGGWKRGKGEETFQ